MIYEAIRSTNMLRLVAFRQMSCSERGAGMNAGEIEDEISKLAASPFDAQSFPFQFLQAFGVNDAAIAKLKAGRDNKSDVPNGVLQRARNNIHLATCAPGDVAATFAALKKSEATAKLKAKYVLATDGQTVAAERLRDGETLACNDYKDLPNHFGVLLELAGISTTQRIEENTFDIRATSKLNKLYVELLRHNPDWDTDARRADLNHFFARLIFCLFAEDTGIFDGHQLFTTTIEQYTDRTGANVHEVLAELFRAMDVPKEERAPGGKGGDLRPFALKFPYVNGNLFTGGADVPRFTQAARIYLLAVGSLDWKKVNPDIFGSMIQAVADDEERGALGMHYTSVPNILKVLNPLFLDDLRAKLEEAGDGSTPASKGQLKRLRDRLARIRVFDPACGSGNFLVIAYKKMREIEAVINERRGETGQPSVIPSTNFRGIEIRHFAAEIARLALIIAKFQCDVLHISDLFARKQVLPLDKDNWITCGNALRLDWLQICPPTGTGVKVAGDDLFNTPLDQSEIDFENAGGETYICGNPPYRGSKRQDEEHKSDLKNLFSGRTTNWKSLDYVAGWFMKASDFGRETPTRTAFVATNSICQGQQVAILWPLIFESGQRIAFARTSFNWANLASHNAGVTVVIVGIGNGGVGGATLFQENADGEVITRHMENLNAYLIPGGNTIVEQRRSQIAGLPEFDRGNSPTDGGNLLLDRNELESLCLDDSQLRKFVRPFFGSIELIHGLDRRCIWIDDSDRDDASTVESIKRRIDRVREFRLQSSKAATVRAAAWAYRFDERKPLPTTPIICVPVTSSQSRQYLPAALLPADTVVSNLAFSMPCSDLWVLSIVASRMLLLWVAAVCARMRTDYRFTNTLCWNTFPVPALKEADKAELTRRAEKILLAREAHFPATIADLYDPEHMPPDLRAAHDRNDETLERIYIGRRFKNDTERLEKLFQMYTEMTAKNADVRVSSGRKGKKKSAGTPALPGVSDGE